MLIRLTEVQESIQSFDASSNICWVFTRPEEWVVDSVTDTRHYGECLPWAISPRSFRQSWEKLRSEFTTLGLCFVPPLYCCPEKWVIEKNRKWALIQLKHMLPFMLWLRILITGKMCPFNQYCPDSDEAVIVTHQMRALPGPELSSLLARFLPSREETQALKDTTSLWRASVSKAVFPLHGFWATNSKATCGKKITFQGTSRCLLKQISL